MIKELITLLKIKRAKRKGIEPIIIDITNEPSKRGHIFFYEITGDNMNEFPTEADVIRKNIEDIEDQRADLQTQIADLNFMLKKLMDKLDKLEKEKPNGKNA